MNDQTNLSTQERLVLEQLRRNYQFTQENFNSLDSKAHHIISAASIIITILASVQVTILQNTQLGWFMGSLILYILTMIYSLWSIIPMTIKSEPLKADWEAIKNSLNDPFDDFFHGLLSEYENVIKHNLAANSLKASKLNIAYMLLGLTVVVSTLMVSLA